MSHTRRRSNKYKKEDRAGRSEHFKVKWEVLAEALILAIDSGDISYRDFKKAQSKVDKRYGNRPLEIKEVAPPEEGTLC